MTASRFVMVLALAAATGACEFQHRSSLTAPSEAPITAGSSAAGSMIGVWLSGGGSGSAGVTLPGLPGSEPQPAVPEVTAAFDLCYRALDPDHPPHLAKITKTL